MINKTKNNISFQAGFKLEGTKTQRKAFIDFMKNEAEVYKKTWNACPFSAFEHNESAVVFTDIDAKYAKKTTDLADYINKSYLFNGADFFDKEKGEICNEIVEFDLVSGVYHKIVSYIKNGIKLYKSESWLDKYKVTETNLPKCDFNKQVKIIEGINVISKIKKESESNLALEMLKPSTIFCYKQAAKDNEKLRNINIEGISGVGANSLVFNIDKEHVIKLSERPCYPKIQEVFDVPIVDKGVSVVQNNEGDKKTVYNCISKRGKNMYEHRITSDNICGVEDSIKNEGYIPTDFNNTRFDQIVKIKNKYHLCDYECAIPPSGKTRLYSLPIEELYKSQ